MKTVLLLALFLYAASAAPAEDKPEAPEAVAVVDPPEEQMAAVPAQEEEAAPEARFNPCPNGWNHYGSRCFAVVKTPMNWKSAKEYCNGLGAHLASVTNSGEYSFLQDITQTHEKTAWLGGFNLQGDWMWTGDAGFYYTNWHCKWTYSTHPCIYLHTRSGWENAKCSSKKYFICSKNANGC